MTALLGLTLAAQVAVIALQAVAWRRDLRQVAALRSELTAELAAHELWQRRARAYMEQLAQAHNAALEAHNALVSAHAALARQVEQPSDVLAQLDEALAVKLRQRKKWTVQ